MSDHSSSFIIHYSSFLLSHALLTYLERSQAEQETSLAETIAQMVAEVAVELVGSEEMKKEPQTASQLLKSRQRWLARLAQAKAAAVWQRGVEAAVQSLLAETDSVVEPLPTEPVAQKGWLKAVAQRLKKLLPAGRADLDARLGRRQGLSFVCGYLLGFLVDHLHNIITVVQVVSANTTQQSQLPLALSEHQQRLGHKPKAVAADSAQDYYPVHHSLDEQQIEGHLAPRQRATNQGFSSHTFVWDEQGQWHCPAGQVLTAGKPRSDGKIPFVAGGCATCAKKEQCLPKGQQPDGPRVIHLQPAVHQRLQQNREHAETEAYRAAQSARFTREGLFGLARRLHHGQQMPYRSQPMNLIAGLMIGFVMNLVTLTRPRRSGKK